MIKANNSVLSANLGFLNELHSGDINLSAGTHTHTHTHTRTHTELSIFWLSQGPLVTENRILSRKGKKNV
jgi:hypothetical protein